MHAISAGPFDTGSNEMPVKKPARQARGDWVFNRISIVSASVIVLLIGGIFIELVRRSALSLGEFGPGFIFSRAWNPVSQQFGALSSAFGTIVTSFIAMLIAVPMSVVIALFLVELAHPVLSRFVGGAIELLAAIPSIIYGMWGLFVFAPFMASHVEPLLGKHLGFIPLFNGPPLGIGMLTAGIVLALMILPFISSVMRDVFQMVPKVVKESAFGVGATRWEVTKGVTIRYGIQGLLGACFLGLGRATGETMAVTFVIGNNHAIAASLFSPGNSIASTLANEFTEASEPMYLSALMELGLVLFVITLLIQVFSRLWLGRMERAIGGGAR
jgi:phosphate transport system permease protein